MTEQAARPLRVAVVSMTYPVASETFAQRDVEALRRLGHSVEVHQLNPRVDGALCRLASMASKLKALWGFPAKGKLIGLFFRLLFSRHWRLVDRLKCLYLLPAAAGVAKRLITSQPDVVHLFWGHYPTLVAVLVEGHLPRGRLSMFLGAYDLEMQLPVSRWAHSACDLLFTHAQVNVADIQSFLGQHAQPRVIHRGIDLRPYPADAYLSFAERPAQIFTAGRLIADKGFDRVIRVFTQVHASCPEARLVIAGTGPELNALRQLARALGVEHAVSFPGWLSEGQVRELLARSRVFILLSTKPGERLPNAVKEGMAAGCVCISSDSPGIEELLEDGRSGFILEVGSEARIVQTVLFALGDDAMPISKAAALKVRSGFDVEVSARRYLAFWQGKDEKAHE